MSIKHKNLHDEIREQNQKFKEMSFKKKLEYFWEYYRFPTIAVVFALILGVSLIHSIVENSKDTVLNATFVNANSTISYETMEQDFAAALGVSLDDVFVTVDASTQMNADMSTEVDLASSQKLMAMSSSNQMDILAATADTAMMLAGSGYFADLRTLLPEALLTKYEDFLVYYTYDPAAKKAEMEAAGMTYDDTETGPYDTLEPVPIGIDASAFQGISIDIYYGMPTTVGICITSRHTDNALAFLEFLEHYSFVPAA